MARVRNHADAAAQKLLEKSGVHFSRKTGATGIQTLPSVWQDCPQTWPDAQAPWFELPYSDWLDAPDMWVDTNQFWDYVPNVGTTAYARANAKIYNAPSGAYIAAADNMRRASALWHTIPQSDRDSWATAARDYNTAAYSPVIDPRTRAPRFATERNWSGFSLFVSELSQQPSQTPLSPDNPARTEGPNMSELLTGADYEQRMLATLDTTSGNLTIIMYQVSPEWTNNALASSELFARLLQQPSKRSACRMVMGTPTAGTTLAALNTQARAILQANGWQVRQMPQYPVLHAKLWLIERGHVYAGSHNLSNRATTSNHEAGILTTANAAVTSARQWTEELWNVAV